HGRLRRFLHQAMPALGRSRRRPVRHPTAQSEIHGVRPFRSGDSPRWIHWRTTARRGELMVREVEETPTDNLIVVVDPWVPGPQDRGQESGTWEEAGKGPPPFPVLEDALSLAATVGWEWGGQR